MKEKKLLLISYKESKDFFISESVIISMHDIICAAPTMISIVPRAIEPILSGTHPQKYLNVGISGKKFIFHKI